MSNNSVSLYSVSELLGKNFFIPSYQRGFRWSEQQVNDLLNDIKEFSDKENESKKGFYCLQPIVVKKCSQSVITDNALSSSSDSNIWYEVIDGQQRLTTLFLIIHYFNEMWIGKQKTPDINIAYETRKNSSVFLHNLHIADNGAVSDGFQCSQNIDFSFIAKAYTTVHTWAVGQQEGGTFDNNSFMSIFKFSTKVIWYEIAEDSETDTPIETFIRINMGKIPLTNAELIKALFLRKRNFNDRTFQLKQIEIASEWDRMEYALQNDSFWWFLNTGKNDIPAHIEYIFDIMYQVAKETDKDTDFNSAYGTDSYATFRFFNSKFSDKLCTEDVTAVWNEVKEYFMTFQEWYNNPAWYHYVGYIISQASKDKNPVIDIYRAYSASTKEAFTAELKRIIKSGLKQIHYTVHDGNYDTTVEYGDPELYSILLLYNIEHIIRLSENNKSLTEYIRFPFKSFKTSSWDIEHIDSQTDNEIKDKKTQNDWIKASMQDLKDYTAAEFTDQEQSRISDFKNNSAADNFEEIKNIIAGKAGEVSAEGNDQLKNSLGNLTLLDSGTNRSYGNALFVTKRGRIINEDKSGTFIPLCTKNVFLKYFDEKIPSLLQWRADDMQNYQNDVVSTIKEYLTEKAE